MIMASSHLSRLVPRDHVSLEGALRPELEAVHLNLLQLLGFPGLLLSQRLTVNQVLFTLRRSITLKSETDNKESIDMKNYLGCLQRVAVRTTTS